jgi:hypothetical protein
MAHYYNCLHTPAPEFKPGYMVFLDSSDIRTTRPSKKFTHHFLGPYKVTCKVGRGTYQLELPQSMSCLHPVFSVVKLMLAPEDPIVGRECELPPEPVLVDDHQEYEVNEILDSRLFQWKLQFLVSWKGYGFNDHQWVDECNVHAPDLITQFYRDHPGAPQWVAGIEAVSWECTDMGAPPREGVMSGEHPFSCQNNSHKPSILTRIMLHHVASCHLRYTCKQSTKNNGKRTIDY